LVDRRAVGGGVEAKLCGQSSNQRLDVPTRKPRQEIGIERLPGFAEDACIQCVP
jgi:hypothetical protein